ncbi:hypothetical protein VSS74_29665 [Conexibacter stalactiti]|uniref:Uncharacterized protein n=1 Tax=Conexibacter stalactiti TaxID=1940611 RepID=A0ABU4HZ00_9ACTN|nr:hypothetical protein [Conexibacter stalactiti]MDW5598566.1 hypothetical protein [Conexibacter stalactiti]MEC5039208.1 hypothetical protein [Conexibacter stalactiti]
MLTATNLFDTLGAADEATIARALRAAVDHGAAATAARALDERRCGSRSLMAAGAELLLELALVTQALQSQARREDNGAVGESLLLLRDTSAAAARLLWRALEAFPRAICQFGDGRGGVARIACGVLRVGAESGAPRPPVEIARAAAGELFAALAASERDGVRVPARLAASLGYVVMLYLLATTLLEQAA